MLNSLVSQYKIFFLSTTDNSQFVLKLICVTQDIVKVLDAVTVYVDSSVLDVFTGLAF